MPDLAPFLLRHLSQHVGMLWGTLSVALLRERMLSLPIQIRRTTERGAYHACNSDGNDALADLRRTARRLGAQCTSRSAKGWALRWLASQGSPGARSAWSGNHVGILRA